MLAKYTFLSIIIIITITITIIIAVTIVTITIIGTECSHMAEASHACV